MKSYNSRTLSEKKYSERLSKAREDRKKREERKRYQKKFQYPSFSTLDPKLFRIWRENKLIRKWFIPRNYNAMAKKRYYAYIDMTNWSFPMSFFYDEVIGVRFSLLFFHVWVDFTR